MQVTIHVGKLPSHLGRDGIQVSFCLGRRDLWLEPTDYPGIPGVPLVEPCIALDSRLHHHGHPDFGPVKELGTVEIRGGHAEHSVRQPVQPNRFANDRGVGSKPRPPSAIAEDGVRVAAGMAVFALVEKTAQDRVDTENIEIVACGEVSPYALRTGIGLHLHGSDPVSDEARKGVIAVTQVFVVRK